MTTFSFTIYLNDTEVMTVKDALEFYLKHCEERIEQDDLVPYLSHRTAAKNILERLFENKHKTSGRVYLGKNK